MVEEKDTQWSAKLWENYLASETLTNEQVAPLISELSTKPPETLRTYLVMNREYGVSIGAFRSFNHYPISEERLPPHDLETKPDFSVLVSQPRGNDLWYTFTCYIAESQVPDCYLQFQPTEKTKNNGEFRFRNYDDKEWSEPRLTPELQKLIKSVKQGAENAIVALVYYNKTGKRTRDSDLPHYWPPGAREEKENNRLIIYFRRLQNIIGLLESSVGQEPEEDLIETAEKFTVDQWRYITRKWSDPIKLLAKAAPNRPQEERLRRVKDVEEALLSGQFKGSEDFVEKSAIIWSLSDEALNRLNKALMLNEM